MEIPDFLTAAGSCAGIGLGVMATRSLGETYREYVATAGAETVIATDEHIENRNRALTRSLIYSAGAVAAGAITLVRVSRT